MEFLKLEEEEIYVRSSIYDEAVERFCASYDEHGANTAPFKEEDKSKAQGFYQRLTKIRQDWMKERDLKLGIVQVTPASPLYAKGYRTLVVLNKQNKDGQGDSQAQGPEAGA